jgi:O-antigen/teichoic acid export membrane protein
MRIESVLKSKSVLVPGFLARRISRETRGFVRDSFVLSISSVVTMAGYFVQVVLLTHLLGLDVYGTFAIAVSFVALVGGFFDVQIGVMPISFAAKHLDGEPTVAAGIFQFGYITELILGGTALLAVAALAPFAGPRLAGDQGTLIFVLYGITLVASLGKATSMALLQLCGRFGTILRIVVLREVLRVALLLVVLLTIGTLVSAVIALVLLESLTGFVGGVLAGRAFSTRCRRSLWAPALASVKGLRRPMLGMLFHTNLVTYAKLIPAQVPTLLLGAMRSPSEVGGFKVATAIAAAAVKLVDPAWAAVLPRLSRLWSSGRRAEIRELLMQATIGAGLVLTLSAVLAFVLREPLLRIVGGEGATTATTVLVLSLAGGVINGTLFWNTPLIYAARAARLAVVAYVSSSLLLAPLLIVGIDAWGANGAAAALLVFTVAINVMLTAMALKVFRQRESGLELQAGLRSV